MLEARRGVRSVWLWVGVAAATWSVVAAGDGAWQADTYQRLQSSSMPIALAILVIGLNAGGRDHHDDRPPLAEDAALDADRRAAGRLLGMGAPCAVGALWAVAVFLFVRAEAACGWATHPGGPTPRCTAWPRCSNRSCSSRSPRRPGSRSAGRAVTGSRSWSARSASHCSAWSPGPSSRHRCGYVTPIQTQPIEVYIGPTGLDPSTLPADWLLSSPDQYEAYWARVIVHVPMAAWHDVYLIGLALLGAGLAVRRRRGRWLVAAGALAVLVGIVAQVLVAPAAIDLAQVVG